MSLEKTLKTVKITITKDVATGDINAITRGSFETPYFSGTDHATLSEDDVSSIVDAIVTKTKAEMTRDGSTVIDATPPAIEEPENDGN